MEDKELFDFFKNRSASFDEMPPAELWNKIQINIDASRSKSFFSVSKIIILVILTLATVLTIGIFVFKDGNSTSKNATISPEEKERMEQSNAPEIRILPEIDSIGNRLETVTDTLKIKKVLVKKPIATIKNDTVPVIKKLQPVFKNDSIQIIAHETIFDSLKIKPQVKGNRLLFETKNPMTIIEFDSLVQKIVQENKTNYGALIIIKAKGHKTYRHIVKFPEKISIPKTPLRPLLTKGKVVIEDPPTKPDSISFNQKKPVISK